MTKEEIIDFLRKKYPSREIKFIGSGSDSTAFRIGDIVVRVPHTENNIGLYLHEESVCKAIKKFIDFDIPNITVHQDDILWIEHKIVDGKKWSWHKFMFHPKKQKNLGISLARFMAQLHSKKASDAIKKAKNIQKYKYVYMPYEQVLPYLSNIIRPKQLEFFRKHYEEIVSKPAEPSVQTFKTEHEEKPAVQEKKTKEFIKHPQLMENYRIYLHHFICGMFFVMNTNALPVSP